MEALKNVYNQDSIEYISKEIKKIYPSFNSKAFQESILKDLTEKELKDRVKLISQSLYTYLPSDFKQSIKIILQTIETKKEKNEKWQGNHSEKISGFLAWPFTQFVEDYGTHDVRTSLQALKELTKSFTAEFAIRIFIDQYPEVCFKTFKQWSKDKNHHVRRLVSEGTRPKLPWAKQVPYLNSNPQERLKLILSLKEDTSDYVRKSIANHLNDISKTHPDLFYKAIQEFDLKDLQQKRIVTHAARTLIKSGDKKIFKFFNLKQSEKIKIKQAQISTKQVKLGEKLTFKLALENTSNLSQELIIHYSIHFLLKNKKSGEKKFLLKKITLQKNENKEIEKSHTFIQQTTRTLYAGKHKISFYINGILQESIDFNLKL